MSCDGNFPGEQLQWNLDFLNLQGKRKLVRKISEFEKSGVKLQCLTEEGKRLFGRVIMKLKKLRVQEIGILSAVVLNVCTLILSEFTTLTDIENKIAG